MFHIKYKFQGRQKLIQLTALLAVLILLAGCGSQPPAGPSVPESSVSSPQISETETAPLQTEEEGPVFEGLVGQTWYVLDLPFADEIGGIRDLAYAAGRLWIVGSDMGGAEGNFHTPALLSSPDGQDWEQVDLASLGFPHDLSGRARLLGMEDEIIVLFENPNGPDTLGDVPQRRPWVLRGDGESWQVTGEEDFGPWQVESRGSGKYLNYWDLEAFAPFGEELILMPGIGWFAPYDTAGRSLGLGYIAEDGSAGLFADYDAMPSPYSVETARKMLVYQDELLAFASSYKSRAEGGQEYFNIWRSRDGRNWTNETPAIEGLLDYTHVNDVVLGPQGLVVTGWQAEADGEFSGTRLPLALFSSDGQNWTLQALGEEPERNFRAAVAGSVYYAYGEDNRLWSSGDGEAWEEITAQSYSIVNKDREWVVHPSPHYEFVKMIGFPRGLLAIGGFSTQAGDKLLLSGDLPFDYLDQK